MLPVADIGKGMLECVTRERMDKRAFVGTFFRSGTLRLDTCAEQRTAKLALGVYVIYVYF